MFKECAVSHCTHHNSKNPDKLFVIFPSNWNVRRKWCDILDIHDSRFMSQRLFVCEDHFDFPEDGENYFRVKMVGKLLRLKKGIVPHRNLVTCNEKQCEKCMLKKIEFGRARKASQSGGVTKRGPRPNNGSADAVSQNSMVWEYGQNAPLALNVCRQSGNSDVKEEVVDVEEPLLTVKVEPEEIYLESEQSNFLHEEHEQDEIPELDDVDFMFLEFAKRFRALSLKGQTGVKNKLYNIIAEAELDERKESHQ